MKLCAALFFCLVPFLAISDGVLMCVARMKEGFGLAIDMWRTE